MSLFMSVIYFLFLLLAPSSLSNWSWNHLTHDAVVSLPPNGIANVRLMSKEETNNNNKYNQQREMMRQRNAWASSLLAGKQVLFADIKLLSRSVSTLYLLCFHTVSTLSLLCWAFVTANSPSILGIFISLPALRLLFISCGGRCCSWHVCVCVCLCWCTHVYILSSRILT